MTQTATSAPGRTGTQHPLAWRVVGLLALANLLNFYDRTIPSIVAEPIRAEFGLSDTQLGLLMTGFTVSYAIAGIVLGRVADRRSRRVVMAVGLVVWSLLTALSGGAWSFASLLIVRLGVGIGEASYAPAANATIADLFPAGKRSRAVAVFQLGLPLGLILAFFTTGFVVEAFDSWRAPFLLAALPGFVVAALLLRIPEPARGATESARVATPTMDRPIRHVLGVRTIWWLSLAGVGLQIVAYSMATFLVPLQQRYFGLGLVEASMGAGVVLGVAGLVGLLVGGQLADRARRHSPGRRLTVSAVAALVGVPLVVVAFTASPSAPVVFVALLALASVLANFFHTSALPAISEVVDPRARASAVAVFFAAFYLLGGAFGPVLAGALSEYFAAGAAPQPGLAPEAIGLHTSLAWLLPLSFVLLAVGTAMAARTIGADQARVRPQEVAP